MIRVEDLCLTRGDRPILDGLSFSVEPGETLAIIGDSGAGKTSLARLLMGLLPGGEVVTPRHGPDKGFRWSGRAEVGTLDVLRATSRQLNGFRGRQAGLICQALNDALNPNMTVSQHLREVMAVHSLPGTVQEVCKAWNIPARLCNRYPVGLSGGEIQRVLTALAMLPGPPVLILDEPTASLDPCNRDRAVEAFRNGADQRSQLLITHDLALARQLADTVAVLKSGRITQIGAPASVLLPRQPERRRAPAMTVAPDGEAAMPPDQPGLYVRGLSHSFAGGPVLQNLTLHLPMGSCLAVLGESGTGKSTLARILSGLEPMQSGRIEWVPAPGDGQGERPLRRRAMVSQHPHRALARHFTVTQVLSEALRLAGSKGEGVAGLLEIVGLPTSRTFLMQRTATLSGGEAQRLVIARALAVQPELLIADEPTAALDIASRERVLGLLRSLQRERGLTILLVTHDYDVARFLADRIMRFGESPVTEERAFVCPSAT